MTLTLDRETLAETHATAARLQREMSWVFQRAWQIAREEIRREPSARERRRVATWIPVIGH